MPDLPFSPLLPPDAFLRAIIEGSEDAIVTKNLQGIVTSWNPGAERVFGYTAPEMIGQPILRLLPPERVNEEQQILARLQRGERVDHFETRRVRKDGSFIDVSLTISPIRESEGKIIGASKIARDITELKMARERLQRHAQELETKVRERTAKLEESLAELEAFSYSLSHDMRAPLRAIQSLTEIVISDHGAKIPEGLPLLQKVVASTSRLDRLIRDVLSFAQLSRSEIPLTSVSTDPLAREIVRERPEYQAPHADVQIEGSLLPVVGHHASLTQCLSNLVDNAVKFVAPNIKPIVRIFTTTRDGRVRINVRDNGIGIDSVGQRRLFEIFQRLPGSSAYEGTGVGLAIVRKAVRRMNGTVGVDSTSGLGSTFWIELPAANAAIAS